ncbi:MAG: tetratricopeptide repeat protein [Elusimicrobiota bacterium]|mgnify:CR=1 FL=1
MMLSDGLAVKTRRVIVIESFEGGEGEGVQMNTDIRSRRIRLPVSCALAMAVCASTGFGGESQREGAFRHARELVGRNEISKAIDAYRKALPGMPSTGDEADACMQLGGLLARQQRNEEAVQEFKKVLEGSSDKALVRKARQGIFFALLESGKYEGAERFIEGQVRGSSRSTEMGERELVERRKDIARHRQDTPSRRAIRQTVDDFMRAIVARDLPALKSTLSSQFPTKQMKEIERQLPTSKITSMEPQIVEIQVSGAEAKATAIVSAAESRASAQPRSFFFKMVRDREVWKIASY